MENMALIWWSIEGASCNIPILLMLENWEVRCARTRISLNREFHNQTFSRPALSAFQAITGIPRYPANCRKYWELAVDLPYL